MMMIIITITWELILLQCTSQLDNSIQISVNLSPQTSSLGPFFSTMWEMSSSRPVNSIQFILMKIPFLFWESLLIYIFDQGNMGPVGTCGTGKQKHWSRCWTWEQEPFPGRSGSCTTPIRRKALWDVHWAAQLWSSSKTRLVSGVKDENLNQYFWEIIILCFSLNKRPQGRLV